MFKLMVMELAKTAHRPKKLFNQDLFDENNEGINKLLKEKSTAFIEW